MGRSPSCGNKHINKGAWTKEENKILTKYIQQHGEGHWISLPKAAVLTRCGKSCRFRWMNYLKPDIKRENFTAQEVELIIELHCLHSNRWSFIAAQLPGRTDNEIKNCWKTHITRILLSRGIDPQTHVHLNLSLLNNQNPRIVPMQRDESKMIRNDVGFKAFTAANRHPHINLDLSIRSPNLN